MFNRKILLSLALVLATCSNRKAITRDELRSELNSASSMATEVEMSINFVRQNRSTYHYAEGHLRYLSDEASRVAKKLHEATSDPATELQLREARSELESLVEELSSVNSAIGNLEALTAAQSRIEIIHTALEKTKSSL